MGLICSEVTITFYPGSPGDTDNPLVLLSPSDDLEEGSSVSALARQLAQPVDLVRGTSGKTFDRGNVRTVLSWETVRDYTDPMIGLEAALVSAAGLPQVKGWVKIELAGRSTTWEIPDVVIVEAGGNPRPKKGLLFLPWTIEGGAIAIHDPGASPPTVYPDGEVLLESATVTDRDALLLETAS